MVYRKNIEKCPEFFVVISFGSSPPLPSAQTETMDPPTIPSLSLSLFILEKHAHAGLSCGVGPNHVTAKQSGILPFLFVPRCYDTLLSLSCELVPNLALAPSRRECKRDTC